MDKKIPMLKILSYLIFFLSIFFQIDAEATTLLICGVAKNCASCIPSVIRNAEQLGSHFSDYRVIIYENNSSDETVQRFSEWTLKNKKVNLISEHLSEDELLRACRSRDKEGRPCRIELIARARNKVLEAATNSYYPSFDQVVMVDLDFDCDWPIEEICRVSGLKGWDCVTSFGVDQAGHYYDVFALRDDQIPLGPEFLGQAWWKIRHRYLPKLAIHDEWLPVRSAYGGLAIYRAECLLPFRYSALVTKNLIEDAFECFHSNRRWAALFSFCRGPNPSLTIVNTDFEPVPVVCEHVTLHADMRKKGFTRIFVNPAMKMRWRG